MSKAKLTYFNGRGLGEGVRLLLTEAGIEFEDVRLEDITPLKPELPFGQVCCCAIICALRLADLCAIKVPLLEIDGLKLVQSVSIARYASERLTCATISNQRADTLPEHTDCTARPHKNQL